MAFANRFRGKYVVFAHYGTCYLIGEDLISTNQDMMICFVLLAFKLFLNF